jgi:hypothetical protein
MSSKRNYLTPDELETDTGLGLTDAVALADIQIAEEIIDAYVGFQNKFIQIEYRVEVSAVTGKTIFDTGSGNSLGVTDNYFEGCILEVVGGAGAGQWRRIESSDKDDMSVTYEGDTLNPNVNATSIIKIYQLGKFPRGEDCFGLRDSSKYVKAIPEKVKRATSAQVEFMVAMGDKFFTTDKSDLTAESILNYSYSKDSNAGSSIAKLIAPKAKALLDGIKNSTGRLVVENQTCL